MTKKEGEKQHPQKRPDDSVQYLQALLSSY